MDTILIQTIIFSPLDYSLDNYILTDLSDFTFVFFYSLKPIAYNPVKWQVLSVFCSIPS